MSLLPTDEEEFGSGLLAPSAFPGGTYAYPAPKLPLIDWKRDSIDPPEVLRKGSDGGAPAPVRLERIQGYDSDITLLMIIEIRSRE